MTRLTRITRVRRGCINGRLGTDRELSNLYLLNDVDVSRSSSSSLSQSLYPDFHLYLVPSVDQAPPRASTHAARANSLALGFGFDFGVGRLEPVPRHRDPSIPHRPSRRDVNVVSVSRISHRIALSSCRPFTHTHIHPLALGHTAAYPYPYHYYHIQHSAYRAPPPSSLLPSPSSSCQARLLCRSC